MKYEIINTPAVTKTTTVVVKQAEQALVLTLTPRDAELLFAVFGTRNGHQNGDYASEASEIYDAAARFLTEINQDRRYTDDEPELFKRERRVSEFLREAGLKGEKLPDSMPKLAPISTTERKFKVGDRVRVLEPFATVKSKELGTVVNTTSQESPDETHHFISVLFDSGKKVKVIGMLERRFEKA